MPTGKVKWYDPKKGFGFIQPDDGGPDIFVHQSTIQSTGGTLSEGQSVEFEAESSPKGLKTTSVRPQ